MRGTTAHRTGRVRAFTPDDLPQVVTLHSRIWGHGVASPGLASFLEALFCRHPWLDDTLPSLVYEDADGRVVGCLGVMPRPMLLGGRPIRAAVLHSFMVEPEKRTTPAAFQLFKKYISGPQDLAISDVDQMTRPWWELAGATAPLLYRLHWTRPLRVGHYALWFLGRHGLPAPLAVASRPLAAVLDRLAVALGQSPFHQTPPDVFGETLDSAAFAACLAEIPRRRALRPEYDDRSVTWLLNLLKERPHVGSLRQMLVRDPAGRALGWYLYYLSPGEVGEVVQIGARDGSGPTVLGHLFHDAWRHGAVGLSGQIDPGLLSALSDAYCLFRFEKTRGVWLHSPHAELLQAVMTGDAFLTPLEGEWGTVWDAAAVRTGGTRSVRQSRSAGRWT